METIVKLKVTKDEYDIRNASKYSISVGELVEILERCPQDAKIVFDNDNGFTFGEISPNTIRIVEVETFEEENTRLEEEDKETLVCPHCKSESIVYNFSGYWQCLDCNEKFKKAKKQIKK
jgi:RNA polymerase subunit RPABC4/transcription elongation factor Spt4